MEDDQFLKDPLYQEREKLVLYYTGFGELI